MAVKFNNNKVRAISFAGSNLQPIKDWSQRTINGVTCYIKDGVGYLNGTSTAGSWQQTEVGTIVLPAGTYTIYFWTNFVETTYPQLLSYIGLGLRSSGKDYYQCNKNKYRTFTLDSEETFNIVFWWQATGMVFDNIWIKSMVKEGAYDATTQYVAYDPTEKPINKLIYNNSVVWCRPVTLTVLAVGSPTYSATITSSEEPSITTPLSVDNGSDLYYGDETRFVFKVGTSSTTTTTAEPNASSITNPTITNSFAGNFGFTVTNSNSFYVKAYWYAVYHASSSASYTRIPSSGYNTVDVSASSTSSRIYVSNFASSASYAYVYVYFTRTKVITTTTTNSTYTGSVSHLTNTTYHDTSESSTLVTRYFTGTVSTNNVTFNVGLSKESTNNTTTTTLKSSTASKKIGFK